MPKPNGIDDASHAAMMAHPARYLANVVVTVEPIVTSGALALLTTGCTATIAFDAVPPVAPEALRTVEVDGRLRPAIDGTIRRRNRASLTVVHGPDDAALEVPCDVVHHIDHPGDGLFLGGILTGTFGLAFLPATFVSLGASCTQEDTSCPDRTALTAGFIGAGTALVATGLTMVFVGSAMTGASERAAAACEPADD